MQSDLPYLVANVGITSTNTQLLLNIIYAIGGWIPAIIGARLHDVVGRRKMMMSVAFGMAICLSIAAGTAAGYVQTGSKAASSASIAFIYVFGRSVFTARLDHSVFHEPDLTRFRDRPEHATDTDHKTCSVFALGYTSMQPIYPGEVLSNDMRAKGMGVSALVSGCAGFVNTFAAPVALRNVSWPCPNLVLLTDPVRSNIGSTFSSSSSTYSRSYSYTSSSWRPKVALWKS